MLIINFVSYEWDTKIYHLHKVFDEMPKSTIYKSPYTKIFVCDYKFYKYNYYKSNVHEAKSTIANCD